MEYAFSTEVSKMPGARNQRRLAAALLKCGENRVWMNPDHIEDIEAAITREDVAKLINKGYVTSKPAGGVSHGRAKKIAAQRAKGRRRGSGSIKGSTYARLPRKERWMRTIRAIRDQLKTMRDEKKIDEKTYRQFYLQAKGGVFRSRAHLISHMKAQGVLKESKSLGVSESESRTGEDSQRNKKE